MQKREPPAPLELRLSLIEGGGGAAGDAAPPPLLKTPSSQRDLLAGLAPPEAAKEQRLRAQLRLIEAELAEARAELQRRAALLGPSAERRTCDADCIVGGCEGEFSVSDGVLCGGCQLFLCHRCFGATIVANECAGGRYESEVAGANGAPDSAAGSLPCPLFPQGCATAHIPLAQIQRALLDRRNRGVDGEAEDIDSPGHSPHKLHLLARRRQAQKLLPQEGWLTSGTVPVFLRRTVSQSTASVALSTVVDTSKLTSTRTKARVLLADKHSELTELHEELERDPPSAAVPPAWKRTCAQCEGEFSSAEGGQCYFFRNQHFMCHLCFGQYILLACRPGGRFEAELRDSAGTLQSAAGSLPCPFLQLKLQRTASKESSESYTNELFASELERMNSIGSVESADADGETARLLLDEVAGSAMQRTSSSNITLGAEHARSLSSTVSTQTPALDCHCGSIPMATIEACLLDPRNSSPAYWRERMADQLVFTQEQETENEAGAELVRASKWSREIELLDRGLCPSNCFETARLRVAQQREDLASGTGRRRDEFESLRQKVVDALDMGGAMRCPRCGVRAIKDDACVHMTCACTPGYGQWCFLCGKPSGPTAENKCPMGEGGCDEPPGGAYLERHEGWATHALPGEPNSAWGAQKEFLRRRQAYLVRLCKEETMQQANGEQLWARLRREHSDLLVDVPTDGRSIDWDALDDADFPLFGSNMRNNVDPRDLIGIVPTEGTTALEERLQEHWREAAAAARARGNWAELLRPLRQRTKAVYPVVLIALCFVAIFGTQNAVKSVTGVNGTVYPTIAVRIGGGRVDSSIDGSCDHDDARNFVDGRLQPFAQQGCKDAYGQQCRADYDGHSDEEQPANATSGAGCICELGFYYSRNHFGNLCPKSRAETCVEALKERCEYDCDEACEFTKLMPLVFTFVSSVTVWVSVALNAGRFAADFRADLQGSCVQWLMTCMIVCSPWIVISYDATLLSSGLVQVVVYIAFLGGGIGTMSIVQESLRLSWRAFLGCVGRELRVLTKVLTVICILAIWAGMYLVGGLSLLFVFSRTGEDGDTVEFACTWPCEYMESVKTWAVYVLGGVAVCDYLLHLADDVWLFLGVEIWVVNNRAPLYSAKGVLQRLTFDPLRVVVRAWTVAWPVIFPSEAVASGGALSFLVVVCQTASWTFTAFLTWRFLESVSPERLREWSRDWGVGQAVVFATFASTLWLHWVYLTSAETSPPSVWAEAVRGEAIFLCLAAAFVKLQINAIDDGADVAHPADNEISSYMNDVVALALWPLLLSSESLDSGVIKVLVGLSFARAYQICAYEAVSRIRGPRAIRQGALARQRRTLGWTVGVVVALLLAIAQLTVLSTFATAPRTDYLCGGIDCGDGVCGAGVCTCPERWGGAACDVQLDADGFAGAYAFSECITGDKRSSECDGNSCQSLSGLRDCGCDGDACGVNCAICRGIDEANGFCSGCHNRVTHIMGNGLAVGCGESGESYCHRFVRMKLSGRPMDCDGAPQFVATFSLRTCSYSCSTREESIYMRRIKRRSAATAADEMAWIVSRSGCDASDSAAGSTDISQCSARSTSTCVARTEWSAEPTDPALAGAWTSGWSGDRPLHVIAVLEP